MKRWPSVKTFLHEYFRKEIRLADQQRLHTALRGFFRERNEAELERIIAELSRLADAFYDDAVGAESGYGYRPGS